MLGRSRSITLQDPLHGPITLDGDLVTVYESFEVQRLARLHQCGVVSVAFPSMTHTRLAHSLGVMHVARLLLQTLQRNHAHLSVSSERTQDILMAALCHDLGHGPYSHLWDELFAQTLKHEARSVLLFAKVAREHLPHFSAERVARVQSFICPPLEGFSAPVPPDTWQYDIICNIRTGVDVDKFDYLVRDLFLSNSQCVVNIPALLESAHVVDNRLCYTATLEREVFGARAFLHRHVYSHPTVCGLQLPLTDLLLENAAHYTQCTNDAARVCSDDFLNLDDLSVVVLADRNPLQRTVLARKGYHYWGSATLNDRVRQLPVETYHDLHLRTVERGNNLYFFSADAPTPHQLQNFRNTIGSLPV